MPIGSGHIRQVPEMDETVAAMLEADQKHRQYMREHGYNDSEEEDAIQIQSHQQHHVAHSGIDDGLDQFGN